jgi:phosphinothricin acetyltransferase
MKRALDHDDRWLVRAMSREDWPAVSRIYREGIATGDATLEPAVPTWAEFDAGHATGARIVGLVDGEIAAWFATSPWSSRRVYRGVQWESVYVGAAYRGAGVGTRILAAGVKAAEAHGVWTLLAGVLAENTASLALHRRCGFRKLGIQRRVGQDREGRWRDVVLLERRSGVVGLSRASFIQD